MISSENAAIFIIDLLIKAVISEVDTKGLNDSIPKFTCQNFLNLLELSLQASFFNDPEKPEKDEEQQQEPKPMILDSWARCRATVAYSDPLTLPISRLNTPSLATKQQSKRSIPLSKFRDSNMDDSDAFKSMRAWKNSAKAFLTSCRDEELPAHVPLKQILDRPSTGERKMRTLMEQQLIKEKQKRIDELQKQETMENQRRVNKSKNISLTYDFEGRPIEVKPSQTSHKMDFITHQLPYERVTQITGGRFTRAILDQDR